MILAILGGSNLTHMYGYFEGLPRKMDLKEVFGSIMTPVLSSKEQTAKAPENGWLED